MSLNSMKVHDLSFIRASEIANDPDSITMKKMKPVMYVVSMNDDDVEFYKVLDLDAISNIEAQDKAEMGRLDITGQDKFRMNKSLFFNRFSPVSGQEPGQKGCYAMPSELTNLIQIEHTAVILNNEGDFDTVSPGDWIYVSKAGTPIKIAEEEFGKTFKNPDYDLPVLVVAGLNNSDLKRDNPASLER